MVNKDSSILITGASGFLGNYVSDWLTAAGYENIHTASGIRDDLDLTDSATAGWLLDWSKPECIIHLASKNSGLANNTKYPAGIMYENLSMSLNLFEEARQHNVKKFIFAGDICSYPDNTPSPFRETDLWRGSPPTSKRFYAQSKRILMEFNTAMSYQYEDWCGINLIFSDIYGIGDKWNPLYGKIIPSAITHVSAAKEEDRDLEIFGSTRVERDFINVADAANAIVLCVEKQNKPTTFNVSNGKSVKIKDMHNLIAKAVGYEKEIIWHPSKVEKPIQRALDISKIKKDLGWSPVVDFEESLVELVKWHDVNLEIGYVPQDTLALSHPS
jgi:GDP-L-fucose synthase|tara:strand:- start:15847 stop:16833 length:987 start_codon:yes stop_codon:yes gene_type:complete